MSASIGLVDRYATNRHGVLSCFDRIIIVGTLPGACYAQGMTSFLYQQGVRIFDYPKFAEPLRDRIRERAHQACAEAGIEIEHVSKSHIRKEELVARVLATRGDAPGLVHDRLKPGLRMRRANMPTPPVVNQRHRPRRELATFDVMRGVAAPTRLILQFIEAVLAIGPIPVQLAHRYERVVRIGHQHGVLPEFGILSAVDEVQRLLLAFITCLDRQGLPLTRRRTTIRRARVQPVS